MHFEPLSCEIKDNNPKELARIIYTFFQHQYGKAIQNHILAQSEYYAAIAHGIDVENAHKRAEQALTNKNDARMLLDFAFERVLKGTGEKD